MYIGWEKFFVLQKFWQYMYISLHDTYIHTYTHTCVCVHAYTHTHTYANKHTERIHSILECALTIDDLGVCLYVSNGPLELAPLFVVVIAKLPDCLPAWLAGWLVGWLVGWLSQPTTPTLGKSSQICKQTWHCMYAHT